MPHEGIVFAEIDPPDAFMSEMSVAWRRADPRAALLEQLVTQLADVKP